MTTKLPWNNWWAKWSNFQPKQKETEEAVNEYDYLFYGGSAGPGKSYFLRKFPIKFLIHDCWHKLGLKGVRAGLFCEDYPALHDRHLSRIPYEFPDWLGRYNSQQHEFILYPEFGGGVIAFRNLDDPSKYLSSEFALIEVDELTKNPKETFDFLRLRKRWPGIERTKFIAASNPGGIGHDWVKQLWILKNFPEEEAEREQFHFIKALPQDNKYLPESYYKTLSALPEKLRKAYRDGNWDVFEGQYFSEWDVNRHIVKPFVIPNNWKRYRAYDHGRDKPACCLWFALDEDGRVYVYREFYIAGLNVDQIAQEIKRLSEGEVYDYSISDPAIFANIGYVDKYGGQTIAETFAHYGIQWIPGSNRRVDGWNLTHQYLYWDNHKRPLLQFFEICYNGIRTIPSLIHDEHKTEDLDSNGEDHVADTVRYFLMSLHERRSPQEKKGEEKIFYDMIRNQKQTSLNDFYFK